MIACSGGSRLEILHLLAAVTAFLFVVVVLALTLLLLQYSVYELLRDAWVLQDASKEDADVGHDAAIAPELVIRVRHRAHLYHQSEVADDHRGERKQEQCEGPRWTECQDGALPAIEAAEEDAMDLTYPHVLARVPSPDFSSTPCRSSLILAASD